MGIVSVYADAHVSGAFTNPNNAIGNTPTTWAGDLNINSNYISVWSMGNLTSSLTPGATQTINILARKGSNGGIPNIAIEVIENGVVLAEILGPTSVTSTTGQVLSATFNTSLITNPNNVEIEVRQISAGGSPSTRNSAQIAYIQWAADVDSDPKFTSGGSGGGVSVSGAGSGTAMQYNAASGSSFGSITVSGSGDGTKMVSGESNGSVNISGAGSGGEFRILTDSSSGALSISGAGTGTAVLFRDASGASGGGVSISGLGSGTAALFRDASGSSNGIVSISGLGSGTKVISGESFGELTISGLGTGAGKSPMVFLTKQVKRNGVLTPAAVYKKNSGVLVQTGGNTR